MSEWLTIGVLARRGGLTAKALRHYDRIGLLRPDHTDPATGYRRYRPDQVAEARLVRDLRSVDLPLDDVRACLADPALVPGLLAAHRRRLEARLTRTQGDLHRLDHLLTDRPGDAMTHPDQPATDQRGQAVALFNEVWRLLEQERRTTADDDRMLHMAHASRYHWGEVGAPVNLVRGEWQCSRVYATLRRAEPALFHARRALELCDENGIADFDRAFCFEALARAHAVAGDSVQCGEFTGKAAAEPIADPEDRELLMSDLASLPR